MCHCFLRVPVFCRSFHHYSGSPFWLPNAQAQWPPISLHTARFVCGDEKSPPPKKKKHSDASGFPWDKKGILFCWLSLKGNPKPPTKLVKGHLAGGGEQLSPDVSDSKELWTSCLPFSEKFCHPSTSWLRPTNASDGNRQ